MQRCFELARKGAGATAPNPMVGAVLVHEDRIIGEGFHQRYGEAHAEVNCLNSVQEADRSLIAASTLYVSLEPCAHFGKTPPCADLIVRHAIPRVAIGCRDPFAAVNGKGIEKLQAAGIAVTVGVCEKEALELNKRFFCFHQKKRPYLILKWAESADGCIAGIDGIRTPISGAVTNRWVHRWRSEEAAILIGTQTALTDDPLLTNRYWPGPSPLRMVIDTRLRLPAHLNLFHGSATLVFNGNTEKQEGAIKYLRINPREPLLPQLLQKAYEKQVLSILVEGGAKLLQSCIDQGCWDEIRVITSKELKLPGGLKGPILPNLTPCRVEETGTDRITYYLANANSTA